MCVVSVSVCVCLCVCVCVCVCVCLTSGESRKRRREGKSDQSVGQQTADRLMSTRSERGGGRGEGGAGGNYTPPGLTLSICVVVQCVL